MVESIYMQTLREVVRLLKQIGLEGIAHDEIKIRKMPEATGILYRGITVSWSPEIEYRPDMSTNERDTVGYPCLITMVSGTGKGLSDHIDRITEWRQKIRRAFSCRRLDNVHNTGAHHIICRVAHGDVQVPEKYEGNYDVGRLIVTCWYLEPRDF